MESDTIRKDVLFRRDLASVKSKGKQNKTKQISQGFPLWGLGKKGKTLTFPRWKLDLWNGFCGFVLSHNEFPHSAAMRGRRGGGGVVYRKKLTFPSFIFYWKEALDELNSHGL